MIDTLAHPHPHPAFACWTCSHTFASVGRSGVGGPWKEIATAPDGAMLRTPSGVYNAGDTVEYQGVLYVAQWWTRNQQPRTPGGPWQPVG